MSSVAVDQHVRRPDLGGPAGVALSDPTGVKLSDPDGAARQRTIALLLDIANDPRFSLRASELGDLASAVRHGGSPEAPWRGVNLQWLFPPESTIRLRPRRRRGLARILGLAGMVLLVLAAVRLWWAFAAAAEAFRAAASAAATGFLDFWISGHGADLPTRHHLPEAAGAALALLGWSLLAFLGRRLVTRSADRLDREELDRAGARLAYAMSRAASAINASVPQDPVAGAEVLSRATAELLQAQRATVKTLHHLDAATQRLEGAAEGLASGTAAVGKSLGLHTGALQHQISELTQVRASLERIAGLADQEF
ncbi:MAG: hypothetical protein Q4G46_00720 [Propionibacteriaceae bacterium]|nr:hypothetical protein [Propionibacteriaceae bacterium]